MASRTEVRYHLRCIEDLGLAEVEHAARDNRMRAAG